MGDDRLERDESEVVRDGRRGLSAREDPVETWLRTEAAAAFDELRADPSRALTRDDVNRLLARNVPDNGTVDDLRSLPAELAGELLADPAARDTEPS